MTSSTSSSATWRPSPSKGPKGSARPALRCSAPQRSVVWTTPLSWPSPRPIRHVLLDGERPVLIDEWQRLPQSWDLVRRAVDDGAPPGSFLLKLTRDIGGKDVKHLTWLGEQLGDRLLDQALITTGPQAYRRKDGVAVVPLALLGP